MNEDTYGIRKRLDFVADVITTCRPKNVLDMGCGTGANLTEPLALRFPSVCFLGADSDPASVAFARRVNPHQNATYGLIEEIEAQERFDLVIASEVIEHVEDPHAFLELLRSRLCDGGKIVITLPNGYGPFEFASLVETLMQLSGIYTVLLRIKRWLKGSSTRLQPADTLAISPHINFFSYTQITRTLGNSGLRILTYRPRTFLCGFGFDQCIRSDGLIAWNARVVDALPPAASSDWMFVLEATDGKRADSYHRNFYARARRYLNEKRWKLR